MSNKKRISKKILALKIANYWKEGLKYIVELTIVDKFGNQNDIISQK